MDFSIRNKQAAGWRKRIITEAIREATACKQEGCKGEMYDMPEWKCWVCDKCGAVEKAGLGDNHGTS